MSIHSDPLFNETKRNICLMLGFDPKRPPLNISPRQTAEVLENEESTLSVWRSVGRYDLPYTKIGSRVVYPLDGVAKFIVSRTYHHTGEVVGASK